MPKKVVRLSDLEVKNAKPENTTKKLSDGEGLALHVSPAGGKSWRFNYRLSGKRGEVTLGKYPGMSLAQARRARDDARVLVEQGIDPASVRRQEKAEVARQTNSFEKVAREWHGKQSRRWSEKHAKKAWGRMAKHLLPAIGSTPIDEVSPQALLSVLQTLEEQGKYETAHRLRGFADHVFNYAIAAQLANANPASAIAKALAPTVTVHRAAIVDPAGVGQLLRAIWGYMGPLVRGCLQIMALTAVRPGEARKMEWSELSTEGPHGPLWTIPAIKTKLRREHLVPLAPSVISILEGLRDLTGHNQYVFPNSRKADKPMSDAAMNMALRRLGFEKDDHCGHGFRSTFSTLARESGYWPHHVIEAALAHLQGNSVSQAYDRALYLPERRELLHWWADNLAGLRTRVPSPDDMPTPGKGSKKGAKPT